MQFIAILRARWIPALSVLVVVVALTIGVNLLLPKRYAATASVVLDVKPDPLASVLTQSGANPAFVATQVDVLTSNRVGLRVVRNLRLAENPQVLQQWRDETNGRGSVAQWLSESFQKNLEVKPARESNVISVTYRAPDARFAAALANAFVQAYLEIALELRVDPARQYSAFFDSRAKEAREALEAAQSKVSAYQRDKGIIATDERYDVENSRLNELSSQLVVVQALSAESGSRQTQATGVSSDRIQEVLANPVISGLKTELSRADAHLQELNAKYGANHPQVVEAKASIADLRSKLEAETRRVTGGVTVANSINKSREADIRASLEAQRQKVLRMKAVRDESAVLVRDAENAQRSYEQVLARLNQTNLESQTTQSNVVPLTQAEPPLEPASPRVFLNVLLSFVVGVLLAVAVAMLLEMADRRVRAVEDVAIAIGLPVIGIMPRPNGKRLFRNPVVVSMMQQRLLTNSLKKAAA